MYHENYPDTLIISSDGIDVVVRKERNPNELDTEAFDKRRWPDGTLNQEYSARALVSAKMQLDFISTAPLIKVLVGPKL